MSKVPNLAPPQPSPPSLHLTSVPSPPPLFPHLRAVQVLGSFLLQRPEMRLGLGGRRVDQRLGSCLGVFRLRKVQVEVTVKVKT